jgi:multisubunit Na+/H+ antiporter MnhE subunit
MVAKVLLLPFLGLLQHFFGVDFDTKPCSESIILSLVVGLTPGEITLHSNKDRHICIKTHTKASPEYIHD